MSIKYERYDNYTGELSSGEIVENKTVYAIIDGYTNEIELLSENEFYDEYFFCDCCGKLFSCDEEIWIEDDQISVCQDCCDENYYYCEECERYHNVYNNPPVEFEDSSFTCCGKMANENYYYCEGCSSYFRYDDSMYWSERDECYYCENCKSETIIERYHHTPDYVKSEFMDDSNRKTDLHIGFELEVHSESRYMDDCNDEACWISDRLGDYVVFEEDCSISPGFEIITRPATLEGHLEYDWKSVFDFLVQNGYVSHNGGQCGLHIHIDRNYFGCELATQEAIEAKFLWLFEKHWNNLVKFSRRRMFRYCNKNPKPASYKYDLKFAKDKHSTHYVAVNLGNDDTIEIRLWRGTLRYETFVATLKFTNRLAYLIKYTPIVKLSQMSWEDILGDDEDILAYWETVKYRT